MTLLQDSNTTIT